MESLELKVTCLERGQDDIKNTLREFRQELLSMKDESHKFEVNIERRFASIEKRFVSLHYWIIIAFILSATAHPALSILEQWIKLKLGI